jgi:hypothetical protein
MMALDRSSNNIKILAKNKIEYDLYMIPPSFYSHVLGGVLGLIVLIMILFNFREVRSLFLYDQLMLLLALSVAAGVHGISHQGMEELYGYYPLGV